MTSVRLTPGRRVGRGCGRRLGMGSGFVFARRSIRCARGLPRGSLSIYLSIHLGARTLGTLADVCNVYAWSIDDQTSCGPAYTIDCFPYRRNGTYVSRLAGPRLALS